VSTSPSAELTWQPSLFATAETVDIDASFSSVIRIQLDPTSWVDHAPEWVAGGDHLFEEILASRGWQQRSRHMYDKQVLEPRLTAASGRGDLLVTGGLTQRTWEHCVPKVSVAGPRISLAYRHAMDVGVYAGKKVEEPEPRA
jgi:alkylated DNA repair dioxygenase AlkB